MSVDTDLQLYCNNNIQPPVGTSFPSSVSGKDDMVINGSYTIDSKGIVLDGTDTDIQSSGDTTFQTISMWFRFNDIVPSFNILNSSGNESASITAVTTVSKARSTVGTFSAYVSGWQYGDMKQFRYDSKSGLYSHPQGTNIVEGLIGSTSGSHGRTFRNTAFANLIDFDYRFSATQYGAVDLNGDVTTSILGVRVQYTAIWSGFAKCIRYRESYDDFVIMIEGSSDQVVSLNPDTGVFTSLYSNTGITIEPRALAVNDETMYFIGSDSLVYSLDITSNTNIPVLVNSTVVSSQQTINYYRQKLYVQVSNNLVEIQVTDGQQYTMGNSSATQYRIYALDYEGGYISYPTSNDRNNRASYDFNGSDGRSYTLTEGTNTISETYIDGKQVDSLEDMINYSYGSLHNVIVKFSNPSTSTLTLFENANVTVDMLYTYSTDVKLSELLFSYNLYKADNTLTVPIPKLSAKTITDFSVEILALIQIDDLLDYQALTSDVYTGTFNSANTFSLNTDIDFSGETKSTINDFQGTFNGNGYHIICHDGLYIFNTINTGASVNGIVFDNFYAPTLLGITLSVQGTGSLTNCVCCGTFFAGSAFCSTLSSTCTFQDNIVMVSEGSRLHGTYGAGVVGRNAEPMTRCFFAGTSDVWIQSAANAGCLAGDGNISGENACNFNGYIQGRYEVGGIMGEIDNTPKGCVGLYACGSFEVTNYGSDAVGRIIGNRQGGTVTETYYYGSGDIIQLNNNAHQSGQSINSATVFSERKPAFQGAQYLETDVVHGVGLKGSDTSIWAGGSFAGPDIFKNAPHIVPVENFEEIHDPIGTIQIHVTNKTDYPLFVKFNFDDPSVSFTVFDSHYREITGYKARIVSRYHTLTNSIETVTNSTGLEYYVNATSVEFGALIEPTTIVGTEAKSITDFSVYIGIITISDFGDLSAMHSENYAGTFHGGNTYIQTGDVQYPDSSIITTNSYINTFEGLFDGNGYRIIDIFVAGNTPIKLSTRATVKNMTVNNLSGGYVFSSHSTACLVKNCKITGDINTNGPAFTNSTSSTGMFVDCQLLASGDSRQDRQGTMLETGSAVKRIFVATQPGHFMNCTSDELGGVMERTSTNVSKIACNMNSYMICSRDEIGLLFGENGTNLAGQQVSKGFYGCGNTFMLGSDSSMRTQGLIGSGGSLNEFYSANAGDIIMQSGSLSYVPSGRGTLFSDFTGKNFAQNTLNPNLDADVDGNQGALYTYDTTIWTAPWDLSSHLDYASILIDVPHYIPIPSDEIVNDVICNIQMYASTIAGYSSFFKIGSDRYETDYHVDIIGRDGLSTPEDGSWVIQFVFPFEVEAGKNIIFRGSTLTSTDSKTYVIGGIPFTPFTIAPLPSIACKDVTDFSEYYPGIITLSDLADFQAVIGVTSFHKSNEFNMTADVDFITLTGSIIFDDFEGTFDGKGYRILNRDTYTFDTKNSTATNAIIKNIIFQNTFGACPVLTLYGQSRITDCVSCGQFPSVLCGLVHTINNYASVERCYVLAAGKSLMDSGISSNSSSTVIGISKSFFCGGSEVVLENGNSGSGCISRGVAMGGGNAVNFLGSMTPTSNSTSTYIGGLLGESKQSNGLGYYVCGDFDILYGNGFIDRVSVGGVFFDEVYYANKGAITSGGTTLQQGITGFNNTISSTAFSEFTGTYDNVGITEDLNNTRNSSAGVYSRAPEIWWSPWTFVTSRPAFLIDTPHFIPIENSEQYDDVLGSITLEMEDISQYPIFIRVDYLSDTEMEIKFFTRKYIEITSSIAVEIVFPLAVDKTIYHGGSVVTSSDNLTYNFGVALGTLVPGYGPDAINASAITDFSTFVDSPIILSTPQDIQAMFLTNYTGTFNSLNKYYLVNDIDLHQSTFDTTNDRIVSFSGNFFGNGFRLSNHCGFFIKPTTGMVIRDLTFMDFQACAIDNAGHDGYNLTFISGNLNATQTAPMLGSQSVRGTNIIKNMKVFLHGTSTLNSSALMGTTNGASELFLVTTSGIHSTNLGVALLNGQPGFNIGCNLNGTSNHTNDSSLMMPTRGDYTNTDPAGGGYYVTGKHSMTKNNASKNAHHTFRVSYWQNRTDQGGIYTAVRGSITNPNSDVPLTTYLGGGGGYATAFKDFVQGITEDQTGILGGMYDINTELWVVPWVLSDHYDHPSMLRAIPHYIAIEDRNPIPSILGEITVLLPSYPMFLEIEFTDNGDGTDSFTYKVLDTTLTEVVDGVVIIMTYPFQARAETSIIFDNEVISADDNDPLLYFMGDPFFFLKQSPIAFEINWAPIQGVESYRLTYEYGTSGEITLVDDLTEEKFFVQNLTPETSYMMRLYSKDVGSTEYVLAYMTTAFTNANFAENYESFKTEVRNETTGIFDLSRIDENRLDLMGDLITDIFEDKAPLNLTVDSESIIGVVAHPGTTVDVTNGAEAIVASFTSTGSGQFIEIEGETGNEQLYYNESDNTFTFNGRIYNIGDSILVNGKSLRIVDF